MANRFFEPAFAMRRNKWMSIVQVKEGSKAPRADAWPQYAVEPPSEHLLARWSALNPHDGVGFAYGGSERIIGVDLDYLIEEAAQRAFALMKNILGPTPLLRIGQFPKRLGLYRFLGSETLPGKAFNSFEIFHKLGTQTVFFGVHPDTGREYTWPLKSPMDSPPTEAPEVSYAQLLELIEALRPIAPPKKRAGARNHRRGASAPFNPDVASDRLSGAVAGVLTDLRTAADPLAAGAEMIADAHPGSRYPSAFGVIVALVKLGHADKVIWQTVSPPFAAHFQNPSERRARLDTIASALRWARAEIGPDAETLNANPAFQSLQRFWEASVDG
jgi:hypothetical protein